MHFLQKKLYLAHLFFEETTLFYKFSFSMLTFLAVLSFSLSACSDDDSSLSGPGGTSVDYRVASIDSLEDCKPELENERAYIEDDSTWRVCKSYKADTLIKWAWRRHLNINGELYLVGYVPAGTYDCNVYDCVTTEYLNPNVTYGEFLDTRDNKVYKTVYIGEQLWMAQNLAYTQGNDSLTGANSYDTDSTKKGYYYQAGYNCPYGWTNPSRDDFTKLVQFTGDTTLSALKTANGDWKNSENYTNPFGFSLVETCDMSYLTDAQMEEFRRDWGLSTSQWSATCGGSYLWLESHNSYYWWYVEVNEFEQNYEYYTDVNKKKYKTLRCIALNYY